MADKKEDKIQIYSMIQHDGQINRARYNPFKTNIIATKSTNGGVYVFNYIQHSKDGKSLNNSTKIHLVGHEDEGFGLTWSESNQGILASAANDSKVLTWDLNKVAEKSKEGVPYTHSFEGHKSPVNDIACHKIWPNVMASCDDQGNILLQLFSNTVGILENILNSEETVVIMKERSILLISVKPMNTCMCQEDKTN